MTTRKTAASPTPQGSTDRRAPTPSSAAREANTPAGRSLSVTSSPALGHFLATQPVALLQVQRLHGNRATTRLIQANRAAGRAGDRHERAAGATQRQMIQRKIGLEFELNHWRTWEANPASELDEITEIRTRDSQSRLEYRKARTE